MNLSGRLPDRALYRDFHHLNERGVPRATALLAEGIDAALDGASNGMTHEPGASRQVDDAKE